MYEVLIRYLCSVFTTCVCKYSEHVEMDYDMISGMKVEELKEYLKLHGLKISGRKVELVARVFAAGENNLPILKTAVEIESDLRQEYKKILHFDGIELPDPFMIASGWMNEEEARVFLPMVLYPEVYHHFLKFYPTELASDGLNDYKTSKAHSYFKDRWLQELKNNNISDDCEYCLIKGSCRKSEKINDPFHQLWIVSTHRYHFFLPSFSLFNASIQRCLH